MIPADTASDEIAGWFEQMVEPPEPVHRLVLIGGVNMALRGIKPTTKDVDIVLRQGVDTPDVLRARFAAAGFEVADGYYLPREPFESHTMFERADGGWVDLFLPDRMFGDLTYTEQMGAGEEPYFNGGGLRVSLADPTTVFLLKTVTGRWRQDEARDLPDLRDLLDEGLVDWGRVDLLWHEQRDRGLAPPTVEKAVEAMTHLRNDGYEVPWSP